MSDYEKAIRELLSKGSPHDSILREAADADRRIAGLEATNERLRKVGEQMLHLDMTLIEEMSLEAMEQFMRDCQESRPATPETSALPSE